MGKTTLINFTILLLIFPLLECSKILIFYPFSTKSHLNTIMPVADELISRGHEIDFVTRYKEYKVNPAIKVHHVSIMENMDNEMQQFLQALNRFSFILDLLSTGMFAEQVCESTFQNNVIKDFIARGKQYDVIIVNAIMSECSVAVSSMMANYTIIATAGAIAPWSYNPAPKMLSALPNYMLPFPPVMTFTQRVLNVLFAAFIKIVTAIDANPRANAIVQKYYPGAPSLQDAWRDASLYFVNLDNIVFPPRPSVPRVINLPGVRCKEAKPLPQEMDDFIKGSGEEGFIVFSLGSIAEGRFLRKEVLERLVLAFSQIKQRVIWKFESTGLQLPPNVKTFKWIPQADLLGHEKARLLIGHGGLLGLQEAICYGVPVIGFPLFADQPGNMAVIQHLGFGETLSITTATADEIVQTIQKILRDDSYRQNARKYTPLLKDYLEPAPKKGAFWIEYVIRHHGAKHLRSVGEDMGFIQYFLIDVIGFIALVLGVFAFAVCKITRLLLRKIKNKRNKTSRTHTKKSQ